MKLTNIKKLLSKFIIAILLVLPVFSYAEVINLNGPSLLPKAEIFTAPRNGNFVVGATFETPIYINTQGNNINAISVKLHFDSSRLAIVNPSGGKSIFGIWVEPPSYDNVKGTSSLVGVIPGGIVTSSGLIATVTFKAIAPGDASVVITDYSSANLNDGLGSDVKLSLSGSLYSLSPKTPEGVAIYSDTHPLQDHWYNNNSPILRWDTPSGIVGYSTLLDVNPGSIPPTTITTNTAQASYENIKDGVWYFHVRANVRGVWGNVSHFQIKVDTDPPAKFNIDVSTLKDASGVKKYLATFLTTDSLSSIDHYEVGNIDQSSGKVESPVFIQTESPYLVPNTSSNSIRVIVRAYDTAGNIRESFVELYPGFSFLQALKKYSIYLLLLLVLLLIFELIMHYLFGHHVLDQMKRAYRIFKRISSREEKKASDGALYIPSTPVAELPITDVPEVPIVTQNLPVEKHLEIPPSNIENPL